METRRKKCRKIDIKINIYSKNYVGQKYSEVRVSWMFIAYPHNYLEY
jgi:hypothetical protein